MEDRLYDLFVTLQLAEGATAPAVAACALCSLPLLRAQAELARAPSVASIRENRN